ncbi:S8 family serine peptidase [Sanyastnella coralliicola]|uniref:S8 family serine peptidase n=1 Tax=Sanyastnella coralliicola TaxID=3069118 RepID=UPI0027B983D0|nr:S8 family serine peptidase [Longitalea sp. SCSIO 12813]
MKKFLTLALALCTALVFHAQEAPYVDGEIIVMLEQSTNPAKLSRTLASDLGSIEAVALDRQLSELSGIYLLKFDTSIISNEEMLDLVQRTSGVRAAQYNHIVTERATPNDPGFGNQWHHVDASDNDIDSDLAWDITTGGTTINGDDIVVCVIEGGGSNYNHVDLIDNHWTNANEIDGNGTDDDGNGYIDDVNGWNPVNNNDNIPGGGHGTAVSGMIGAKGNNGNGGAGVNWDVSIMQVTVGGLNEANVIAAYNYPYVMRNLYNTTNGSNGAFVVATNASWGIDNANPANYPVWCAYYDDLGAVGILNCGATANNNVNIDVVGDMPTGCASDYMVAVTATNSSDVRTFSGYGATTIDLGAPGESVYLPSGSTGYSNTSGTSFASPCVAGAIALIYSAPCSDLAALAISNPQLAADMVRGYIMNGVDPVANLAGECVTGGRLNVRNSIDLALGNCGPLPPCDPVSIAGAGECYLDINGDVQASIVVDVEMSEAFCSAETVCFRPVGGTWACDDLVSLGVDLNNTNTYAILGLASNTDYEVYFTTAEGSSSTIVVSTGDCDSQVPGCTDPLATNYDAAATFDDGSCVFPCSDVTLTIDTDCWGGEVSWEILDAGGSVVASVSGGTYGNQQTYTWSGCLEFGCYTFNIFDSFGDGLDGTGSGCAVDGNYSMSDDLGNELFAMGAANYGSGTSHSFCVPVDLPGCTDPTACNYDAAATTDDGSCVLPDGCTDASACNYDPAATCDDGSCILPDGCTNPAACNYNAGAVCDDGSCILPDGCTDASACNYDPSATCDDGSCILPDGCTDPTACNYDAAASCDDGSCEFDSCGSCPGDFNEDGSVDVADLLIMLGDYGCLAGCTADMNDDGFVNSTDMLGFLAAFGFPCVN